MSDAWHEGFSLRSWGLKNFKSVRDSVVVLAPLTVVVGANSAGKSTLLESIRVAAQAALADSSTFPLNGEQIRLGTFQETRFAGATSEDGQIEISATFHHGQSETASYIASTPGRAPVARRRPRRPRDTDLRLDWRVQLTSPSADQTASSNICGITVSAYIEDDHAESLKGTAAGGATTHSFGHQMRYTGELVRREGEPRLFDHGEDVVDIDINGGFPRQILKEVNLADDLFWTWHDAQQSTMRTRVNRAQASAPKPEERLTDEALVTAIVSDLRDVIGDDPRSVASYTAQRQINVQLRNMILSRGQTVVWSQEQLPRVYERVVSQLAVAMTGARAFGLPELLDEAVDDARHFLATRVQHLGPLRMDPQVVYQSSPVANPGFIGAKGEYSASVLQASGRDRLHAVPMPPGSDGPRFPTLLDAVNQWAAFLGIGEGFHTTDQGKIGLQMSVRQPGVDMDLDLTSVGTGVSQLLPVLVMCLQAPPGSLLLIEQPELHLNPAVQQRLADFLLAIAKSGRQLLIETHSDFLVTRLRLRTAEDQTGQTQDQIALVFAERRDGATNYEVVKPSQDGSIADWPTGFFDEAARDSFELLRAVLEQSD